MIIQNKKKMITNELLTLIKETIFNEPFLELFNNVKIHKLSLGTNFNYFIKGNTILKLPIDNRSVVLYKVDLSNVSGLFFTKDPNFPFKQSDWVSLSDYCDEYDLTFDIFDNQHRIIHKSAVKINTVMSTNTLYIAIDSSLLYKFNYDYDELYINVYRDSNVSNVKTIYTYNNIDNDISKIDEIITVADNHVNKDELYIYINGYYYTYNQFVIYMNENYDNISTLDLYIDLYIDENVYLAYTFESIDELKYYTNESMKEKYILHLLKELNPDKKMFTFNTMDIFLLDTNTGFKYNYFDNDSISQLTFNDVSLSKDIVDSIMENFTDKKIYMKIRYYDKNNTLYRNKPLIDLLYLFYSDDEIVDILSENHTDERLNCIWGGSKLEISEYSMSLFDFPKITDEDDFISKCVNILGYYKVLELINNLESEYSNFNTTDIQIEKSLFYKGENLYPLITKNGLLETSFSYIQNDNNIDVTLGTQAEFTDKFHVKSLPELKTDYEYFTPISGNDLLTINKTSSLLFLKVFLDTSIDTEMSDIDGNKLNPTYLEIDLFNNIYFQLTETEADIQLQFTSEAYDSNFVISHDDHFTYHIHKENIDLTGMTEFSFLLKTVSDNPFLYIPSIMVFLNGYYLSEGIDFYLVEFKNANGSIGGYRLMIQNINHLDTLNDVDVYISSLSNHEIFKQRHFSYNNIISCDNKLDTNLINMTISTNGKIINQDEYENRDTVLINSNTYPESSTYSFDIYASKAVKDWLIVKSTTTDCNGNIFTEDENFDYIRQVTLDLRDMIENLDTFINTIDLTSSDEEILIEILSNCDDNLPTNFYEIHSPYVNMILKLIDDEVIIIPPIIYNSDNPDPVEIENLLSPYEYLKIFDLILNSNFLIKKYVNIILAYDEDLINLAPNGTNKIIDYITNNYFQI